MANGRRGPRNRHHEDWWDRDWRREAAGPRIPRGRPDDEAAPYGYDEPEDALYARERARERFHRYGMADPTGPSRVEFNRRGEEWRRRGPDYGYYHAEGPPPGPGRRERLGFRGPSDEVTPWYGDDRSQGRHVLEDYRGIGPRGYTRSDERIREDVCDGLTDDPALDASEIEVAVAGSEVTLSGTVGSRAERRRAEDDADRVSGVTHVQNNLRVRQPGGGP
ncbi:BON domain-containing protein [Inquilinus limosus]|uniref:BON domain-containing protein n=1 Tax=Inquilinus limosus TaxID=171674 RepID=UPI003F5CEEF6